jgi:hypothetical protein
VLSTVRILQHFELFHRQHPLDRQSGAPNEVGIEFYTRLQIA